MTCRSLWGFREMNRATVCVLVRLSKSPADTEEEIELIPGGAENEPAASRHVDGGNEPTGVADFGREHESASPKLEPGCGYNSFTEFPRSRGPRALGVTFPGRRVQGRDDRTFGSADAL